MNFEGIYPLGHSATEMGRLELQSKLFEDPQLLEFAKQSSTCLEIGSGTGSNLPALRIANPALEYQGIDLSKTAVDAANATYGSERAKFSVGDVAKLEMKNDSFNLVFSKLVLWSMGGLWKNAIAEAHRVLKTGGIFYAFEPYDPGVIFEPQKTAFQKAFNHWGMSAAEKGLDLCIGPKIPSELERAGFRNIKTKFFPVLALASETNRYNAICDNLMKFYFGETSVNHLAGMDWKIIEAAKDELQAKPEGIVMDAFFVSWGEK